MPTLDYLKAWDNIEQHASEDVLMGLWPRTEPSCPAVKQAETHQLSFTLLCTTHYGNAIYIYIYTHTHTHTHTDNGQRKVWSSGGSTHCTCQLTSLINVCPWVWCRIQLTLAIQLCSRLIPECAVSHVTPVLAIHVSCIVLGTLRTTTTCERVFL